MLPSKYPELVVSSELINIRYHAMAWVSLLARVCSQVTWESLPGVHLLIVVTMRQMSVNDGNNPEG
jgi:hypothetical protein